MTHEHIAFGEPLKWKVPIDYVEMQRELNKLREIVRLYAHGPNWHEFGFRCEWRDKTYYGQYLAQKALEENREKE